MQKDEGYTSDLVIHFNDKIKTYRNVQPGIQIDLSSLAQQLTVERARTFANEAMGRRLPVIEQTVLNIFEIYPPERIEFLSKTECTDVAIQLHAFAINVYAIFDNAAWIAMLEGGGNLSPMQIGLFKKDCQQYLPQGIIDYISKSNIKKWFDEYGKIYRDSTAHRIPPYLPSRTYTPEEGSEWQDLDKRATQLLLDYKSGETLEQVNERLAKREELEEKKEALGRNSLLVALTLTGEDSSIPFYLHPQLLCDWGLVQEFVSTFTKSMREEYGWKEPHIPNIRVC